MDEAGEFIVEAPPQVVRERIEAALHPVRSLWSPSMEEMAEWRESDALLYVRWRGRVRYEIGPRVISMNAARFCPVLKGELEEAGGGTTRMAWELALPSPTGGILMAFLAILGVWGVAIGYGALQGDDKTVGWGIGLLVLLFATLIGPVIGRVIGGPQLLSGLDWLRQVVDNAVTHDHDDT